MVNSNVVAFSQIITPRNRSGWVLGSLALFAKGVSIPLGAEVVEQLNIQEQLYQALALGALSLMSTCQTFGRLDNRRSGLRLESGQNV
jgi:hypothetical protein